MNKEQITKYILGKFFSEKDRELAQKELEEIVDDLFDLSQSSVIGNEKSTLIIRKRFGILDNGKLQSFEQISNELKINKSTVIQIILTELTYMSIVFEYTKSLSNNLSKLNLSMRTRNILYNSKIFTIEQIIEKDRETFKNIKNLGGKAYNEVIDNIHRLGYCFDDEQDVQIEDNNKSYLKSLKKL